MERLVAVVVGGWKKWQSVVIENRGLPERSRVERKGQARASRRKRSACSL